eukprot:m.1037823 g.1037823  ORF g.1037823 m.1037823 type:complete len:222 (-) comp24145_c0_seq21:542-1207(-)
MAPGGAAAANTDASVVDGQVPCRRGYVNIKLKDATSPAPNSNAASHEYEYQNAFDAPLNERTYATTRNCLGSESTSPSNSDRTTSTVPSDHTGDTEEIDAYQYTQMLHRPTPTQSDAVDLPYGSFGEHLAPLNEGSPAVASTSTYVLETQLASGKGSCVFGEISFPWQPCGDTRACAEYAPRPGRNILDGHSTLIDTFVTCAPLDFAHFLGIEHSCRHAYA